jgi:hypothetical protein
MCCPPPPHTDTQTHTDTSSTSSYASSHLTLLPHSHAHRLAVTRAVVSPKFVEYEIDITITEQAGILSTLAEGKITMCVSR